MQIAQHNAPLVCDGNTFLCTNQTCREHVTALQQPPNPHHSMHALSTLAVNNSSDRDKRLNAHLRLGDFVRISIVAQGKGDGVHAHLVRLTSHYNDILQNAKIINDSEIIRIVNIYGETIQNKDNGRETGKEICSDYAGQVTVYGTTRQW